MARSERAPTTRELGGAAAVAQTLSYVVGLAGVIAGAFLFRSGQIAFAVVAWVVTFAVGAGLMIAAQLIRAVTVLLTRMGRIESDVALLVGRQGDERGPDRDPWIGHP